MRASAKFNRIAITDYTNLIAILLSEQSHGTHSLSFGDRHIAALVAGYGSTYACVGQMLDLTDFLRRKFLEVREVETQTFWSHERTFLLDMGSKNLAESFVKQMRSRMVARRSHAGLFVDRRTENRFRIRRHFLCQMHTDSILPFCIIDFDTLACS